MLTTSIGSLKTAFDASSAAAASGRSSASAANSGSDDGSGNGSGNGADTGSGNGADTGSDDGSSASSSADTGVDSGCFQHFTGADGQALGDGRWRFSLEPVPSSVAWLDCDGVLLYEGQSPGFVWNTDTLELTPPGGSLSSEARLHLRCLE